MVVEARGLGSSTIVRVPIAGQRNEDRAGGRGPPAQLPGELVAVDPGHADIQTDHAGRLLREAVQRARGVLADGHVVPARFQQYRQ